jgi:predicted lipid-binding transport protein (Tim44 family)
MQTKSLLVEGITDAAGVLAGGFAGLGLGKLMGLDINDAQLGNSALFGIALIVLGAAIGLQAARRLKSRGAKDESKTP